MRKEYLVPCNQMLIVSLSSLPWGIASVAIRRERLRVLQKLSRSQLHLDSCTVSDFPFGFRNGKFDNFKLGINFSQFCQFSAKFWLIFYGSAFYPYVTFFVFFFSFYLSVVEFSKKLLILRKLWSLCFWKKIFSHFVCRRTNLNSVCEILRK